MGLVMDNVGMYLYIYYSHLVNFTAFWYILWLFGIFCGHLVYFVVIWYTFPILVCFTKENLATLLRSR
jgi:hypothetical protein